MWMEAVLRSLPVLLVGLAECSRVGSGVWQPGGLLGGILYSRGSVLSS